jgi:hypothetical protein
MSDVPEPPAPIAPTALWPSDWARRLRDIPFLPDTAKDAMWATGMRPFYRYRELSLERASGGLLAARHVRAVGRAGEMTTGWHCHDLTMQFYRVAAWVPT